MEILYDLLVVLTFSVVAVWVFGGVITGWGKNNFKTPIVSSINLIYPSILFQSYFWLSHVGVI